ncbi:MAG: hypothetical protein M3P28_03530 [Thermoproteota archaeon]|nr:hypothetical protein [Thermoproteota archaeon]
MPMKLSTTIGKIQKIPNTKNIEIMHEFLDYMRKNDSSEHHQNNNLKVAIAPTGHTAHHDLPKKNRPAKIIGYQKIPDSANVIRLASEDSGPVKPSYMNATNNITKNICKNNG